MNILAARMALVVTAATLTPFPAEAQVRTDRFIADEWSPRLGAADVASSIGPDDVAWSIAPDDAAPSIAPGDVAFQTADRDRTILGTIAGGLIGLAIGAGAGYLLYQDETAGCDDGICGWVPPMVLGGAGGLVIGGLLGYDIAR